LNQYIVPDPPELRPSTPPRTRAANYTLSSATTRAATAPRTSENVVNLSST
jgi:hypothetical protein